MNNSINRTIKHHRQNAISAPHRMVFLGLILLGMSDATRDATRDATSDATNNAKSDATISLHINNHALHAEIADSHATRQQGLMHRFSLPADHAMLFVFETDQRHCMWMRHTYIPLSVAFLDRDGIIINIASMKPLRDDSHCALMPARYALEVNEGWFQKHGVSVGTRVIWENMIWGDIIHE